MGRGGLQYLESLDSVRADGATTRPPDGAGSGDEPAGQSTLVELQAFLDVVMTLAFGREVVVPQSYAFDSGPFLAVAERVLAARDRVASAPKDRPFRPHLFGPGIGTFDAAISSMLARVHDRHRPFVSSLHPGLDRLDRAEVRALAGDLDAFAQWAGGQLTGRLQVVRDEFRQTSRVRAHPRTGGGSLDGALADLVDPASPTSVAAALLDGETRATYETLRQAVSRLRAASPDGFAHRSRLRRTTAWQGGDDGPTALDIVGTDEALALVVEYVDTVYNRVVFDSIGVGTATFSTTVARGPDLDRARVVAQRLALGRASVPPANPSADGAGREAAEEAPLFEVVRDGGSLQEDSPLAGETQRLFDRGTGALIALFEARTDGGGAARGNEFWRSVERLDGAVLHDDARAVEKALESHVRLVAAVLQERAEVRLTSRQSVELALTGAGAAVPAGLASGPLLAAMGLSAVGAMAPLAVQRAGTAVEHRRARRRLASALGDFVGVTRTGARP